MELRRLGESGLGVSYLCLGAGMFGNPSTGCDERVATEIVSAYIEGVPDESRAHPNQLRKPT
jgi:aryl-alcohol dehydrogenase-like predicted oxidoreductase